MHIHTVKETRKIIRINKYNQNQNLNPLAWIKSAPEEEAKETEH